MDDIDVGSCGDWWRRDDGTEGTDVEVPLVPQRWVRHAQMQVSFVGSAVVSSTCVDGICRFLSVSSRSSAVVPLT